MGSSILTNPRSLEQRTVYKTLQLFNFQQLRLVHTYDASISASARKRKDFLLLALALMLASLRRTCEPGRRKHKHKHKKNNQRLCERRYGEKVYSSQTKQCACVFPCASAYLTRVNILALTLMLASYV